MEYRVTQKGLDRIEQHLNSVLSNQNLTPELQAGERAMLERLKEGFSTDYDMEFYLHELKESAKFRKFGNLLEAHLQALEWRKAREFDLFHPDVVQRYKYLFGINWGQK